MLARRSAWSLLVTAAVTCALGCGPSVSSVKADFPIAPPVGDASACLERGDAGACVRVGEAYRGRRPRNLDGAARAARAAEFYRRACDLGSYEGCGRAALVLQNGPEGVRDYVRALATFRRGVEVGAAACERGDAGACAAAGAILAKGLAGRTDPKAAAALLGKACDRGLAEACYYAGEVLRSEGDAKGAVAGYRAACTGKPGAETSKACMAGAELCADGAPGLKPDPTCAIELGERSCQQREGRGCLIAGRLLRAAATTDADRARAVALLRTACDRGSRSGCEALGPEFLAEAQAEQARPGADPAKVLALYERACKALQGVACLEAARMVANGQGVPQNLEAALRLWEQACEHSELEGALAAGEMLRAAASDRASFAEAARCFMRSCRRRHMPACLTVHHVVAAMPTPKATAYLAAAHEVRCDAGDLESCGALGVLYCLGDGVDRNRAKGLELLGRACAAKVPDACETLQKLRSAE